LKFLLMDTGSFYNFVCGVVEEIYFIHLASTFAVDPVPQICLVFRYLENLIDFMDTVAEILGQDAAYNQVFVIHLL